MEPIHDYLASVWRGNFLDAHVLVHAEGANAPEAARRVLSLWDGALAPRHVMQLDVQVLGSTPNEVTVAYWYNGDRRDERRITYNPEEAPRATVELNEIHLEASCPVLDEKSAAAGWVFNLFSAAPPPVIPQKSLLDPANSPAAMVEQLTQVCDLMDLEDQHAVEHTHNAPVCLKLREILGLAELMLTDDLKIDEMVQHITGTYQNYCANPDPRVRENFSVTIPLGYYRDRDYYPLLMTFAIDRDGNLCLEKLSCDPMAAENVDGVRRRFVIIPFVQGQSLDDMSVAAESIRTILSAFQSFQHEVLSQQPMDSARLEQMRSQWTPQPSGANPDTLDIVQILDELTLKSGERTCLEEPSPLGPPSNCVWSLVQTWVRRSHPESIHADRLFSYIHLLNREVRQLHVLEGAALDSRLPALERLAAKFERITDAYFGEEGAFRTLTQDEGVLRPWGAVIGEVRKRCNLLRAKQTEVAGDVLKGDLDTYLPMRIPGKIVDWRVKSPEVPPKGMAYERLLDAVEQLQRFSNALRLGGRLDAFNQLDVLCVQTLKMLDLREYSPATQIAQEALRLLPVPAFPLDPTSFWGKIAPNEILEWAKMVNELTAVIWESALRQGAGHVWPKERTQLFKARAILDCLIRKAALTEPTYAAFARFAADPHQVIDSIQYDQFLVHLDAHSHSEVAALLAYFSGTVAGGDLRKGVRLDDWKRVSGYLPGDMRLFIASGDRALLDQLLLDAGKQTGWQDRQNLFTSGLPDLFVCLREHMVMSQCLLQPENSLFLRFPNSSSGMISATVWFNGTKERARVLAGPHGDENQHIRHLQQLDLVARVKFMPRLRFAIERYLVNNEPSVIVIGDKKTGLADVDRGLVYRPSGLDIEGSGDLANPMNTAASMGEVDPALTAPFAMAKTRAGYELTERRSDRLPQFDTASESEILVRALQSEHAAPLDRYLLCSMNVLTTKVGGLDHRFGAVEALDLMCQRPSLLGNEQYQRLLLRTLFHPGSLSALFESRPDFVQARALMIHQLSSQAVDQKDILGAVFLLNLGAALNRHIPADKYPPNLFPSFSNHPGLLLRWIMREQGDYRKMLCTAFLGDILQRPESTVHTSAELGTALYAYALLRNDAAQSGLPSHERDLLAEADRTLLPRLAGKGGLFASLQIRDTTLDHMMRLVDPEWRGVATWSVSKESPLRFECNKREVDLLEAWVTHKGTRLILNKTATPLPAAVSGHPTYRALFGDLLLTARATPGAFLQERIYDVELPQEECSLRIVYNGEVDSLHIQMQRFGDTWTHHRFTDKRLPKSPTEDLVRTWGVWTSQKDRHNALVIIGAPHLATTNHVLFARAHKGELDWLSTSAAGTPTVCVDPTSQLTRHIGCVAPRHLLTLGRGRAAERIHFLDHDIQMVRTGREWSVLREGRSDGFTWIPEPLTATHELPKGVVAFLTPLERALPHCSLLLKSADQCELLIWPYALQFGKEKGALEERSVTIVKEEDIEKLRRRPVLKMTISQEGLISSSCTGFLYLAVLYQALGEPQRAYDALRSAADQRLESSEFSEFSEFSSMLRAYPGRHTRDVAFKAKAELICMRILRQQSQTLVYSRAHAELYFQQRDALRQAFDLYETKLSAADRKRPNAILAPELRLTADELEEYSAIEREALRDVFTEITREAGKVHTHRFETVDSIAASAPKNFLRVLSFYMREGTPPRDIKAAAYANEDLLTYFFQYAHAILEEKISAQSLQSLMVAPVLVEVDSNSDQVQEIRECVHFARCYLITLAFKTMGEFHRDAQTIIHVTNMRSEDLAFNDGQVNALWRERNDQVLALPNQTAKSYLAKGSYAASYVLPLEGHFYDAFLTRLGKILQYPLDSYKVDRNYIDVVAGGLSSKVTGQQHVERWTTLQDILQNLHRFSPMERERIINATQGSSPAQLQERLNRHAFLKLVGSELIETRRLEALQERIASCLDRIQLHKSDRREYMEVRLAELPPTGSLDPIDLETCFGIRHADAAAVSAELSEIRQELVQHFSDSPNLDEP